MKLGSKNLKGGQVITIFTTILILFITGISFGQTNSPTTEEVVKVSDKKPEEKKVIKPFINDYKGVKIGMKADDVKEKLGKTKYADKDGFYYIFSKEEQAQIVLDKNGKVIVISVTYSDKDGTAPKFAEVFGNEITPPAQGKKMYKLVRYPTEGYWVAYHRLVGREPTVTVTIQKMRNLK